MSINVDDTSSSILYSGDWDVIVGSTRQWGGGTVHSTSQHRASATITFTGTRIVMYCTLFHGTGNEIANINFDGQTTTVSKPSQSQDVYNDVWFDSGEILGVQHTLIVSNGGGPTDTPFQLDQFFIEGVVDAPSAPPPPPPPPTQTGIVPEKTATLTRITTAVITPGPSGAVKSSSSRSGSGPSPSESSSSSAFSPSARSSGTSTASLTTETTPQGTTVVSIQYIPTASVNGNSSSQVANSSGSNALNSASKKPAVGGIVGGVVGALCFVLSLLLLLFILRCRKKSKHHVLLSDDAEKFDVRPKDPTAAIPFPIVASENAIPVPQPIISSNSQRTKYKPPTAEVPGYISPVTATSSTGMYTVSRSHSSSRRSIEKHPDHFLDTSYHSTSQSLSPFADTSPTLPAHPVYQHDSDFVPSRPRPLSDATIVASPSASIPVPLPDAADMLRPPSYHQNPGV